MLPDRKLIYTILTSLVIFFISPLNAQEKFVLAPGSDLKVSGTSTLHDWEMVSKEATGEAKIKLNGKQIESISGLNVAFAVNTLKSGKGQMDDIAYETLKEKKFPEIRFQLTDVQQITPNVIKAKGNLTIAGTTKPVLMEVNYQVNGNNVVFTGTKGIKFTEFKMDPPKALFGTIKTGDELKLSLKASFKAVNQQVNQ